MVKYLHIDSWECGSQNWGYQFAEEFKARRGYDLIPYLPIMAGVPMESASRYEQVLKDIRLTINDLVNEKFFKTFTDLAHEQDIEVTHESIAPTFPADGLQHYRYVDHPMGEYWFNSPTHDKPNDMLDAVSGAHIYNKNIVQAEGFTEVRGVWNETPAMLKPMLDRNLALGMNKLFFHVTAHNPWMDRKPGMTLDGIGLFFQRDNTWYPEARGFVDYITLCQNYLQQGRPVVDIAVFHPSGNPEQKNSYRAPRGYKYDLINNDALLKWNFEYSPKGKLPGNQDYRILVASQPDSSLSAEIKAKLEELREEGIVIIDKPYQAKNFSQYGIDPDVILPENMDYAHRLVLEATGRKDIYFLINQENKERQITATFRTGTSRIRQIVNLNLPAYGSVFVILSNRDDMQIISPAKLPLP